MRLLSRWWRHDNPDTVPVKTLVPVCSLDCRRCMEAVARTPGGVPYIVVAENIPHDDRD